MATKRAIFEVDGIEAEVRLDGDAAFPAGSPVRYSHHIRPIYQIIDDYSESSSTGGSVIDGCFYRHVPGAPICEESWLDRDLVVPSDICRCHNPVFGPQEHPQRLTSLEDASWTEAHRSGPR